MNTELRKYVEENILPVYKAFDAAHQENHVNYVIDESLRLAQFYDVDEDMVYVVAAYHDLGLKEGRERHHIVSGEILIQDKELKRWFTKEQLSIMRYAVEDHRASNSNEPRSIYGRIVAEADRQIDKYVTLRRTVQYGLKNHPDLDKEGQYCRVVEHLMEKYAEGGYLKLFIPESDNARRLADLRMFISSPDALKIAFDKVYSEEIDKK